MVMCAAMRESTDTASVLAFVEGVLATAQQLKLVISYQIKSTTSATCGIDEYELKGA